jgi:signal peptidase I
MMNDEQHSSSPASPSSSAHGSFFSELFRFAIVTLLIVLPIRIYIAQPFIVSGSSMDPTFMNGEYLIVDELTYRLEKPERGDVIVFRFPQDTSKFFIKRIIGLPGETVDVNGNVISIENSAFPKGFTLDETYLTHKTYSNTRTTLGSDEYFVMGDNRSASSDSRIWGPLPQKLIIGRALVRLLPITRAAALPGKHMYGEATTSTTSESEEPIAE